MDLLYAIASIASAAAAVLAWVAKIYWSKEHIAAKDETIRAKEAQITLLQREIDGLKELTPMKIREYFNSVKTQLEEYNDSLKSQIEEARREIAEKQDRIGVLTANGSQQKGELEKLATEKKSIEEKANSLEAKITALKTRYEGADLIMFKLPRIDPAAIEQITKSSQALGNSLAHVSWEKDIAELSASLSSSMNLWRELGTIKMPKGLLSTDDEETKKPNDDEK